MRHTDQVPVEITNAAPPPGARLRVLVADDHPMNRKVIELMLAAHAADITNAADGREAVEAFGAGRFDLVLMDMQMPVVDGLEAIRRIRRLERAEARGRTLIAVLSANGEDEHAEAAATAGADHHLAKPINVRELLAIVDKAARPSEQGGAEPAACLA